MPWCIYLSLCQAAWGHGSCGRRNGPRGCSRGQAVELYDRRGGGGAVHRMGRWEVPCITVPCSPSPALVWSSMKHQPLTEPVYLQRGRWGNEGSHPLVSCDHGLLHAMMSQLDAANGYQWSPHMQGGSAWAQGNMRITTAHASMPAAAMILMVASMAAIFAQLPASTMGQDCGQKKPRAHLGLRRSRAKLPRRLPIARTLSFARRRGCSTLSF